MSEQATTPTYDAPTDDPDTVGEPVLRLDDVTKEYGPETAVQDLSLSVHNGELLTLVGPSGCGKTTTLRLLAGLERPTEGTVSVAGEAVAGDGGFLKPEQRDVGIVFQDFALFPHLTVAENVAFGLQDVQEDERKSRVTDLLDLVGLSAHREKKPDQLSGGQQQRVALARSLAPEPAVLLLDEPFSNLDVRLRVEMREEVRAILKEAGVTTINVTHDQEEALSISDRIAVMNDGRVEQVGDPTGVFQRPESRFVASFLGQAGFLSGVVRADHVETGLGNLLLDGVQGTLDGYQGARIEVLVRPDDLRARRPDGDPDGEIVHRQYSGPSFIYRVELACGDVLHCLHNHVEEFAVGDPVDVKLVADHPLAWFPSE